MRLGRWWLRLPKWRFRAVVVTTCLALVAGVVTVLPVQAQATGDVTVTPDVTVTSVSMSPNLSLSLAQDKGTVIPSDKVGYTATLSDTGATLSVSGVVMAKESGAAATVQSWWWSLSTNSPTDSSAWTTLAAAGGTNSGWTPTLPQPGSGVGLSATPIPIANVSYPGGGDRILGTVLNGEDGSWNYTATVALSPAQTAFLLDPSKYGDLQVAFHVEASPHALRNQTAVDTTDIDTQLAAAKPSGTVTGAAVTVTKPDGSTSVFNPGNTPALATVAPGTTVPLTTSYQVPNPAAKKAGEDDGAYLARLTALENSALKTSATATATSKSGSGGTLTAAAAPTSATEHLPVVAIAKSGPASADAGFTATYPLKLTDSGGATAINLAVTDALPDGSTGTVTGTPPTIAAGGVATASAAYSIPGQSPSGPLTDTAAVTWTDGNGDVYGPVSSAFTTDVVSLYAGSTLSLSPTTAGPDVTGAQSQTLVGTFLDSNSKPIAGQPIVFAVTGPNARTATVSTAADGTATFTYTGAHDGTDSVQATFTSGTLTIPSNTASVGWVTPVAPASIGTSHCDFFTEAASATTFVAKPGDSATFGQDFPNIAFDPPSGAIPNNYTKVDTSTRPFTDVTTDLAGNANGTIPAAGPGHQAGVADMASFDASCTGNFTVAKPGDVTFSVNAASGFLFGVGGGATRVNGAFEGDPPATVPFTGFATVGANAAAGTDTAAQQVTVHFPTAGSFPFEVDGFFTAGAGAESLVLSTVSFTQQTSPLSVYVGYADGLRAGGSQFPYPWNGSPNVTYEGGCTGSCAIDSGAIRLDNSGTTAMTVNHLTVRLATCTFDIWPKDLSLPPGQTLIYTQMSTAINTGCPADGSFDTSDTIGYGSCANNGVIPQVTLTVNGATQTFDDTGQILDTYGHDLAGCPNGTNESLPWTRIGGGGTAINTPLPPAATLNLSPRTPSGTVGMAQTLTVSAMDASGKPIPGLPVSLIGSGVQSIEATGTTDATGVAQIGIVPQAAGAESFQALGFVTGMHTLSNIARATWAIQSANPPPGGPPPNTNPPPSITAPGLPDGTVVVQPSAVTAVIAPPTGQTLMSWQSSYISTKKGSTPVVIAGGSGPPPTASAALLAARATRAAVRFAATTGGAAADLGTFDPTLLANGTYQILITATASGGGTLTQTSTVTVDGVTKPGAFKTTITDASIPVSGFDIAVERSYDSTQRATSGDFGHGWHVQLSDFQTDTGSALGDGGWSMYDTACSLLYCQAGYTSVVSHTVTVTFPDGHDEIFDLAPYAPIAVGRWAFVFAKFSAHPGTPTTSTLQPVGDDLMFWDGTGNLVSDGGGTYDPQQFQLTLPNQTKLILDRTAGLTQITDPAGNVTKLDSAGLHGPANQGLTFTRDGANRITQVTGPAGMKLSYGYDSDGNLAAVTDANGTVTSTYGYDASHLLTSDQDASGAPAVAYTYDSSGRLTSIKDSSGNVTTISTDTAGHTQTVTSADGKLTTVTTSDDRGRPVAIDRVYGGANHQESYVYNALDQVTSYTDPMGETTATTFDATGNPLTYTDASGRGAAAEYDANNNVVRYTGPGSATSTYTYDANGNITSASGPLAVNAYTYDSAGHMLTRTDGTTDSTGKARTWSYTWDAAGRMATSADPAGAVTAYTRDDAGRVTAVTDPDGGVSKYVYDPAGHLLSETNADNQTTTYTYDADYRVLTVTDPAGGVSSRTYDADGNLATSTDALKNTTSYTYDALDRMLTSTDPMKGVSRYAYDGVGDIQQRTDPLGNTTAYTYDADNRLIQTTDPLGGVTKTGYDPDGRVVSTTDATGGVTTTAYNQTGDVSQVTDPRNQTTKYSYDADGDMTSVLDPLGRLSKTSYDVAGRVLTETDPTGAVTGHGYDAAGRQDSVTDPLNRTSKTVYDPAGRVLSTSDPAGDTTAMTYDPAGRVVSLTTASGIKTTEAYDAAGRPTSVADPLGHTIATSYDALGHVLSVTDPNQHTTSYGYDADGRQTSMKDATGATVGFGYDADGNRTSTTDADGRTTTYGFDAAGRQTSITDPLNRVTTTAYDAAGRPTTVTDARKTASTRTYDAAGQLTGITTPDGPITYGYDAAGQLTSTADPTGTVTTGYDGAGRITSQTSPAGTLGYVYDAAGQRTSMTQPGGTVGYSYDAAGRLSQLTDLAGGATKYAWTSDGALSSITRPNGVVTTDTYDTAGRLTGMVDKNSGGTTLGQENYTLDAAGNRTAVTSNAGTTSYTLDQLNRLTGTSGAGGTFTFGYDAAGNRTSAGTPAGALSFTYDAAGQLATSTGPAGTTSYTYDAAGDLTGDGTTSYTYDWAQRLTGITAGTTNHTFSYAADGVRATADGTALLSDRTGDLPQLVQAGSSTLTWGANGDIAALGGSATQYPLTDAQGSVTGITDTAGASVGTTAYDPYGSPTVTGQTSPVGYTGALTGPANLVDLNARWYDPALARFLSADSIQPGGPGTQGWNRYSYVGDNPTTDTDPSGHFNPGGGTGTILQPPPTTTDTRWRCGGSYTLETLCLTALGIAMASALVTLIALAVHYNLMPLPWTGHGKITKRNPRPDPLPLPGPGGGPGTGTDTQDKKRTCDDRAISEKDRTYFGLEEYYKNPADLTDIGCRATGAIAQITSADLASRDGSPNPKCDVCEPTTAMKAELGLPTASGITDAGHLIGYAFSGRGDILNNLVPMYKKANQVDMNNVAEAPLRRAIATDGPAKSALLIVTPDYPSDFTNVPTSLNFTYTLANKDGTTGRRTCTILNLPTAGNTTCVP
ncbi:MAG: hypothetical protein HOW97_24165 [Catenulispora sp.]|nr:hypothetical protein [Catenulispora sp.]